MKYFGAGTCLVKLLNQNSYFTYYKQFMHPFAQMLLKIGNLSTYLSTQPECAINAEYATQIQ